MFGHYLNRKSNLEMQKEPAATTRREHSIHSKEECTQELPLTEPTSRRYSLSQAAVKDRKNIVIKVDVEGSNHANLKKVQYVNQVKDIYNSETKYVSSLHSDYNGNFLTSASY